MSDPIRVLITEDSATLRKYLRMSLESDPSFSVVGEAHNGEEAIELCRELDPDIITMDIRMPRMNGLEAIRRIMAEMPRPIVVLTTTKSDMEMGTSFKAIEAGALMVLGKPRCLPGVNSDAADIVAQVKAMSSVKVVGRKKSPAEVHTTESGQKSQLVKGTTDRYEIVVIGASTGGPAVVHEILSGMPADLSVPIVVVQHLSPGFINGLAHWLQESTALSVKVARNGELLSPGTVYLAPDGRHLTAGQNKRLWLIGSPPVDRHRPSVNVLFESAAEYYGPAALGLLLTGMGADGARGLKHLKEAGGYTIAQDEASSVVFGMPGEAIKLDAARAVIATDEIVPTMLLKLRQA